MNAHIIGGLDGVVNTERESFGEQAMFAELLEVNACVELERINVGHERIEKILP